MYEKRTASIQFLILRLIWCALWSKQSGISCGKKTWLNST